MSEAREDLAALEKVSLLQLASARTTPDHLAPTTGLRGGRSGDQRWRGGPRILDIFETAINDR
jgi:hypothetical protein